MLKDADIVILDEASAFADPECEAQVQLAFRTMAKGRTVIMIAHRLSTVRNADRIYVLRDGQVEEQGKHEDLLKNNGLYADMWAEYASDTYYLAFFVFFLSRRQRGQSIFDLPFIHALK